MMREKPKILFAPMEGIGSCYYRRVHHRLFPEGVWRYYTPFLSVYPNLSFRKRDLREILGEDEELKAVTIPQIRTIRPKSSTSAFTWSRKASRIPLS